MTAQIHDTVIYKNEEYSLVGVHGNGLFNPLDYGLQRNPNAVCTACYRGYQCSYSITDKELLLSSLEINLEHPTKELFGIQPDKNTSKAGQFFNAAYLDLALKIPLSGGILIAKDFIEELYVHIFHPALNYKIVHEIIFSEGQIQKEHERSHEVAQFRDEIKNTSLGPTSHIRTELSKWIERCFSLDYKW